MDADWAQAWISGAAILASGVFAVWVPWRERRIQDREANRRRFDVDTERFQPSGLTVNITYQPEFNHIGLACRVTLLAPEAAQLVKMREAFNPGTMVQSGHVIQEAAGVFIGGVGVAQLQRAPTGVLFGSVRILPPPNTGIVIEKARLRFEIISDSGERLYRVDLSVSPVDRTIGFPLAFVHDVSDFKA